MNSFSISQLAHFSGIKAHTIRIWEQRYHALNPGRTEGNTRYYDNQQLRRLLNIVSLANLDYKVSELCAMPDKKLFVLVEELKTRDKLSKDHERFIVQLISAGMSYDEPAFEKILSHCILHYGMKETYLEIIYPMLVRIGYMWSADTIPPAHEHFISNLLRQKLLTAIDSLPLAGDTADSWLLFLPENEFHEIGLLFAGYLLRVSGRKVIYLGCNLPIDSLTAALKSTSANNLLLFFVHRNSPGELQAYINSLSNRVKRKNIFIASDEKITNQLNKRSNIHFLNSVEDLEKNLTYK